MTIPKGLRSNGRTLETTFFHADEPVGDLREFLVAYRGPRSVSPHSGLHTLSPLSTAFVSPLDSPAPSLARLKPPRQLHLDLASLAFTSTCSFIVARNKVVHPCGRLACGSSANMSLQNRFCPE